MSRRSTTMLLLIAVALAIGVAWWWSQQGTPELPPIDAPVPSPVQPAPVAPADAPPQHVDPMRAALPAVWGEVQTVGTFAAPTAPVVVRRGDAVVPGPVSVVGGAGQPRADEDARSGQALVRALVNDAIVHRVVRLAGRGEPVVLQCNGRATLRGKVLGPDRKPIVGARLWTGDVPPGAGADEAEARSDDDGAFALDVEASSGVPLVVRADGFAWTLRIVDAAGTAPIEIVLAPECALTVRWAGTADALVDARVVVEPSGAAFATELLAYPFFAQALLAPCRFDAQGQAVVRGLPRGATIGVRARGPRLPLTAPQPVELLRATADVTLLANGSGRSLRGVVADRAGKPIADAVVGAWAGDGAAPAIAAADRWLFAYADQAAGTTWATTDAQGAFELTVPDAERCTLAVTAPGCAELRRSVARADLADLVHCPLPAWDAAASELRIPPPVTGTAWAVRIEPDREYTPVAADQPFVRAFAQPTLVNLRVRVALDGSTWSEPRVANEVTVLGSTALPAELLRR